MAAIHSHSPYAPGIIWHIEAAVDLVKQRFIGFDGNLCGAGAKSPGVIDSDTAAGKMAPFALNGVLIVEAGGTVTAEGKVESDASGRAVDITTGEANGWALTGATAAGQFVLIARGI